MFNFHKSILLVLILSNNFEYFSISEETIEIKLPKNCRKEVRLTKNISICISVRMSVKLPMHAIKIYKQRD